MSWKLVLKRTLLANLLATGISLCSMAAYAQGNVSVVHLGIQNGNNGQLVVTPKGALVPLPGAGVNGGVVDIYMGANGGFWYVDRNGQTVDLTSYVQQVRAQQMQAATPPQYSPYPANYSQASSTSSSGSSALSTAAAAGAGAMVGASMAHYNNVPYGTPMYYGANGRPYYRDVEGKDIFVDDGEVQWNNVAKANQAQNYRQTQKINQAKAYQDQQEATRESNQQQRQAQSSQNQQQRQQAWQQNDGGRDYARQSQQFQQQQQWYQEQSKDRNRAQTWQQQSAGDNPFVRAQDSDRNFGSRGGEREARGGRENRGGFSERGGGRAERGGARGGGGGGRRGR